MSEEPEFTLGIEEEYLLVDPHTRELVSEHPAAMFAECEKVLGEQVAAEFLQCQIEIGTRVCHSIAEAREQLQALRSSVGAIAARHGVALMAASTHPFTMPDHIKRTEKERYAVIEQDLQEVVRRLMICGMHVHVGIGDDDQRIDLMNQVTYILPHLLALSTSSPFWHGHDTGLKSYRVAVWDEMPRTGLPQTFGSYAEYRRLVEVMVQARLIEDGTKIWWDVRPSARFPTLEVRIMDVCTDLEDAIAIAAVFRCWLRMLHRLRRMNQRWRMYPSALLNENRWLAQRYGIDRGLVDFGRGEIVDYAVLVDEMLSLIAEDAQHFDCVAEVEHVRTILARGTSAHWQIRTFEEALASGCEPEEAHRAVVDMLVARTRNFESGV